MKNILFVAYYFPPDNGVGGLRIAKFARYLPSFGWEPTVLTVEDRYREQLDLERGKDLGETRIVKTLKIPRFTDFLLLIKRILSGIIRKKRDVGFSNSGTIYSENFSNINSETLLQMMKRYYTSFSFLPDGKRCWVLPATMRALFEIKRGRIVCMMTSSPPHSSHLIGLIVKRVTKVKWLADFRDPWVEFLKSKTPLIRCSLSDKIEQWLEALVVHNADKIITTTEEHRKAIMSRFLSEPSEKFIYIPNGIDTDKFLMNHQPDRYETFTISYTGTIGLDRSPEPLFKAIDRLIASGRIDPSEIKIKLFGNLEPINGKTISSIANIYGLKSIVEVSSPIPFSDALLVMQRSHLLLLLATPIQRINIPAKVYDYFGSGTKIIAISEPSATSELIQRTRSGACFDPTDVEGIAEHVLTHMKRQDRNQLRNDPALFADFDTKLLTGKLAQLLS